MKRRQFLSSVLGSGAAAAVLAVAVVPSAFSAPGASGSDADIVLREGKSLEIEGAATLGSVELRGGSINTRGGGVFHIASLRKA